MATPETALTFPCDFPIKVMGLADAGLEQEVMAIINRHAADATQHSITTRPSSKGKYLAITIHLRATSRQQLDGIYRDLTACEQVLMAL